IIEKGLLYADNLFEIADNVKKRVGEGEALKNIDLDFDVVIGKAKTGVRTEAQFNTADRIAEKISKSKVGQFVNETTVATGVSLAYSVISASSKRVARSKLMAWGSFGGTALLAGGIAGFRENKRFKEDRRQHLREMAQNKEFDEKESPRRNEMEEYRYETKNAEVMTNYLSQRLYIEGTEEIRDDLSEDEIEDTLGALAQIESRIRLSDNKNIDLISYSDITKVEQERRMLDSTVGKIKDNLRKKVSNFSEDLDDFTGIEYKRLIEGEEGYEGVKQKNELFQSDKKKKVAVAVGKGVATGLVIGAAAQELTAFFRDEQQGLVEGFIKKDLAKEVDGKVHYTPLGMLKSWLFKENPTIGGALKDGPTFGENTFKLPEGTAFVEGSDGKYNLTRGKDILVEGLGLNKETGQLSDEAKLALEKAGVGFKITSIDGGVGATVPVQAETLTEFMEDRVTEDPENFQRIDRKFWYDQDDSSTFTENELKLHWGGQGGTGINEKGDFVFNIQQMTEDGSYHGDFDIDAQKAIKNGELKMLLSVSKDTQSYAFEVPIDANGNAIIEKDSEIGKMLFDDVKGKAVFKGKFAEVAQMMEGQDDPAKVDKVRLLATHVGDGLTEPPEIPTPVPMPDKYVTGFSIPADKELDLPPIIPIFGRTPLEPTIKGDEEPVVPPPSPEQAPAVAPE
ncbi:MAG: hypothetical protein HQ539_03665, partial [Parcubacteria group bacterium]|nr:hypothetical protein [Parcubacteria group bacterium]